MASTLSEPLCCHQARIVAAPKIIAARAANASPLSKTPLTNPQAPSLKRLQRFAF
jgi:hypothetical protein